MKSVLHLKIKIKVTRMYRKSLNVKCIKYNTYKSVIDLKETCSFFF